MLRGFAVSLEYGISRLTSDIDVLDVASPRMVAVLMKEKGKGFPLAIMHKVYLNIVGIANAPYDYESRLRLMCRGAFQHLHLIVMDAYDVRCGPDEADARQRERLSRCPPACGEKVRELFHRASSFVMVLKTLPLRIYYL